MKPFILLLVLSLSAFAQASLTLAVPGKGNIAAVAFQLIGNTADIATSWHQPERTHWLATDGRFQGKALAIKISLSGTVSVASVLVSRLHPRSRKLRQTIQLVVCSGNVVLGGIWASTAVSNTLHNPALR